MFLVLNDEELEECLMSFKTNYNLTLCEIFMEI